MRLAYKLIAAVTVVVLLVLTLYGWLRVRRESGLFESDMRRDHRTTARALAAAVATVADQIGDEAAGKLVSNSGRQDRQIFLDLVWLDAPDAAERLLGPEIAAELRRSEAERLRREAEGGAESTDGDGDDPREAEAIGVLVGDDVVSVKPFLTQRRRPGAVRIRESLAEEGKYIGRTVMRSIVTGLTLAIACALAVTWIVVRFIARPLNLLVTQARRVGGGDFSVRLALSQRDEMAELAREMNVMCDELDRAQQRVAEETANRMATLDQLRHADRLTTVGKVASGLAHELGTPLNVVQGRAKLILEDASVTKEIAYSAKVIHEQAERMTKIIRQMLDFARRRGPRKERVDLSDVAARTMALLESMAKRNDVTFEIAASADATTEVDPSAIQQVFTNLFVNAIQAMASGGRLSVRFGRERRSPPLADGRPEREYVAIHVVDTGVGMKREVMEHVFEPFFTTKDVGEGTGLGLSVSYGIVSDHGGFIEVRSEEGKGSDFGVYLPAPST